MSMNIKSNEEFGTYVALDLGGTNFRIMLVDITIRPENQSNHDRRHSISMDSQEYFVPQSVMLGTGVQVYYILNKLIVLSVLFIPFIVNSYKRNQKKRS